MAASSPLSEQELRFLQDTEFLTAKHHIQKVIRQLLEQTQKLLQQHKETGDLPQELWQVPPKISRGENYEWLPYLVLDYPRIFQQEEVFAYRSMLWWGHEFSCTLHLSGSYWQQYQQGLLQNLAQDQSGNWWVGVHDSPWEYHFRPDNYRSLEEVNATGMLASFAKKPFFKLSRRLPIAQHQQLPFFSLETFRQISKWLTLSK